MFNSKEGAQKSLKALKVRLGDKFERYEIGYNTNEKILEQLLQVFEQKAHSETRFIWSFFSEFRGPTWFNEIIREKFLKLERTIFLNGIDFRTQVAQYGDLLLGGYNVLAVAHSQGNFYANEVFDLLEKKNDGSSKSLSILSVANPDDHVGGGGDYVTLKSDWLIRSIPQAMPANVDNINPGLLDHAFVRNYLDGEPSGKTITDSIHALAEPREFGFGRKYDSPAYLHRSLMPMKNWVKNVLPTKKEISTIECLATSIFLKVENWFGVSCQDRNIDTLIEQLKDCSKEWFDDHDRSAYFCGLIGLNSMFSVNRSPLTELEILQTHKECHWQTGTLHQKITTPLINSVADFLRNPK